MKRTIIQSAARYWWLPMITGLLAIGVGVWCLANPDSSLPVFAYVFSIILAVAGFMNLAFSLSNIGRLTGWGFKMFIGIIELICGIWMLMMPEQQMVGVFIYGVGFYLVFVAITAICETCMFYGDNSFWLTLLLTFIICTLVFAFIFLAGPIAGGIAVWLYIGIAFICFGLYRIFISAKIYQVNKMIN